ncbi:MAG: glycosyltransferase family 4 protein [Chloroflexi bacterium]|nr:glycosyltransferase family 4 protein [Chloroflexota bacterium]
MARRLKVLHITSWYPSRERPLSGIFVQEHVKAAQLHHDGVVLHLAGPDSGQPNLWRGERETDNNLTAGIPTHRLFFKPTKPVFVSRIAYMAGVWRTYRKLINERFRPDVIHAHSYVGGAIAVLIGKIFRVPVVVSEHSTGFAKKTLAGKSLINAWLAFRGAEMVLPVSAALQKAIQFYVSNCRFRVVPNTVDTKIYFPVLNAKKLNDKQIIFVGHLHADHRKGIPFLLQSLAEIRCHRDDWQLHIVGDGPARLEHERKVVELGIADKIIFHGRKMKPTVAKLMRQSDFLVVSSLVETFSVVAAEALASGIPVLTTRCGGPEEFVTSELGMVIQPGDVSELREGLQYMLDNSRKFSAGEISDFAVKNFSIDVIAEKLRSIYINVG